MSNNNNWTPEQDEILKQSYKDGTPTTEIAAAVGKTVGAVKGRATYIGIKRSVATKKSPNLQEAKKTKIFACKFCGQVQLTFAYENWDGSTPAELEERATLECNCPQAKTERHKQQRISHAQQRIVELFGESCDCYGFAPLENDEALEVLNRAVVLIANGNIYSASIGIVGGTQAKISGSQNTTIKVTRSETNKYQLEE